MPITLDGTNGITTPTYGGADTSEYLVPVTQFKNKLINSDMRIDQRNAGASVNNAVGDLYTLDRWTCYGSQASKFTVQQNAGSVTPPVGFKNYLGVTSSSAYSVGASEAFRIAQWVEGFNVADLDFGTANAKTLTISFWVRSSLTGTFGGQLLNSAADRAYPFTYTISSANTWEYKTVTVAGDTTGTWITNNGKGLLLGFGLGYGSSVSGTANAWNAGTAFMPTGATSVVGTNGATFYITGVQLEVGSTATSFDYRPYQQELALCQRYYYKINAADSSTGNAVFGSAYANTTTSAGVIGKFPVTMRTYPTALEQSGTASNYQVQFANTNTTCSAVPTYSASTSTEWWRITATVASGLTAGQGGMLFGNSSSAYLAWSAEL